MKIERIECPYCGGNLNIESGLTTCFCNYCGKQLYINDGVQRIEIKKNETIHYVDDAKLRELELKEQQRIRYAEQKKREEEERKRTRQRIQEEKNRKVKRWWIIVAIWLVVFCNCSDTAKKVSSKRRKF